VSVDIADIKTITIVKKSKVGKGAGFGFLGGASLGVVIGLASGDDPPGFMSYTAGDKAAFLGIAFGLIGMILGAAEGASAGADQKIQIEGKSDSEIKEILEDLREKARVPNFQ
jgi:hypothetical protein